MRVVALFDHELKGAESASKIENTIDSITRTSSIEKHMSRTCWLVVQNSSNVSGKWHSPPLTYKSHPNHDGISSPAFSVSEKTLEQSKHIP